MNEKEIELSKIKDFLQLAKYRVIEYKPSEKPDSIFSVKQSGQEGTKVIGIEHTDYYNDATPGQPSPGELLYDFWGKITDEIESKINQESDFHNVNGYFKMNKQELWSKARTVKSKPEAVSLSVAIANQMYDLVGEFLRSSDQERSYCTYQRMPENMLPIPSTYSELNKYFLQIDLQKVDFWQSIRYGWHANVNASHIGLSAPKLVEIVHDKQEKCRDYSTDNIDELWLLIAAPATTVYNETPNFPFVVEELDNVELREACESSEFNKVFFWSRKPPTWFKQIWPT
jgi:hypothetical protein